VRLMGAQLTRSQVDGAVFDVQRPRVPIKIVRTDLPNFLFSKMHHVRQGGTRQGVVHESQKRLALFRVRDVLCFGEGLEDSLLGALLNLYEFIELPLLPRPNVIAFPLSAINQFVSVQVRESIGVSCIVPVIVALLARALYAQPPESGIDDLLINKLNQ